MWLPYAIAALALLAVGAVAAIRSRRDSTGLAGTLITAGAVLALATAIIAGLAEAALDGNGIALIDPPVWSWMIEHRTPALTWLAIAVSDVGSTIGMAVIAIVTAGLLWWRGRRSDALLVAVVAVGAGVLVRVGKSTIGRERPPEEFWLVVESNESFPSGHSLASAAILGVVVVVLVPLLHATWARVTLIAVATVFALAIGVSRPYLGVHWATDVLGGWAIGLTWLFFCVTVRSVWQRRRDIASAVDEDVPTVDEESTAPGDRPAGSPS